MKFETLFSAIDSIRLDSTPEIYLKNKKGPLELGLSAELLQQRKRTDREPTCNVDPTAILAVCLSPFSTTLIPNHRKSWNCRDGSVTPCVMQVQSLPAVPVNSGALGMSLLSCIRHRSVASCVCLIPPRHYGVRLWVPSLQDACYSNSTIFSLSWLCWFVCVLCCLPVNRQLIIPTSKRSVKQLIMMDKIDQAGN